MQSVRIIEIPKCKVVSSGVGIFGDEKFNTFHLWFSALPKTYGSRDFLFQVGDKLQWIYLYEQSMDVPKCLDIIEFTGGLYAVTTDIDQQTDIDVMDKELHTFLHENGFEQDESRPRMGNVITSEQAEKVLGYNQMDYFMPIKSKSAV